MSVETKTPGSPCPKCKKNLDGAMGHRAPQENDITICIYCGSFSKFNDNLLLQNLSEEEEEDILNSTMDCFGSLMTGKEVQNYVKKFYRNHFVKNEDHRANDEQIDNDDFLN